MRVGVGGPGQRLVTRCVGKVVREVQRSPNGCGLRALCVEVSVGVGVGVLAGECADSGTIFTFVLILYFELFLTRALADCSMGGVQRFD